MEIRRAVFEDTEQLAVMHANSIRKICGKDYKVEQIEAWAGGKTPEQYINALRNGEDMFVAIDRKMSELQMDSSITAKGFYENNGYISALMFLEELSKY